MGIGHLSSLILQSVLLNNQKNNRTFFLQYCGTEDFLYVENQYFKKKAERLLIHFNYEEGPGEHTWAYWDETIQIVLEQFNSIRLNNIK